MRPVHNNPVIRTVIVLGMTVFALVLGAILLPPKAATPPRGSNRRRRPTRSGWRRPFFTHPIVNHRFPRSCWTRYATRSSGRKHPLATLIRRFLIKLSARPTQFLNIAAVFSVIFLLAVASQAQTYTVIDELLGQLPSVLAGGPTAVQGRDGAFYATSLLGGTSGLGTILKFTSSGTVTTLYSFDGTVGQYPSGGLTLGSDGNFYGTANRGSTAGNGSIFKVTSTGAVTLLHAFTNTGDGTNPAVPPVLGTDGNFYGSASGVDVSVTLANSTIYKITPSGNFSVIHTLDPVTEGSNVGYLILGINGNFYGAAVTGGVNGWGTIFKVTPTGALTVLHAFNNSDGRQRRRWPRQPMELCTALLSWGGRSATA